MHPLEQQYSRGADFALAAFGLEKVAIVMGQDKLTGIDKIKALRPQAVPQPPGPASQAQMVNPAAPPVLPGGSGLQLDRSGFQGGHGTRGPMPGAVMNARGQVVGLPNKMASAQK